MRQSIHLFGPATKRSRGLVTRLFATCFTLLQIVPSRAFTTHAFVPVTKTLRNVADSIINSSNIQSPPSPLYLSPADLEVIPPSYELAVGTLALGSAFGLPGSPLKSKLSAFLGGIPLTLFAIFIAYQTTTLRFTFSETDFSLVKSDLTTTGENVVVGGENSWRYNSFVNYDYFPSRSFPILVYFKETQTPEEMWNVGPGEQANSPEAIAKGAKPGQVHFFPAIGNVEQMNGQFEKHNCAKIN